jgi:hypothetical protein
MFAARRPALPCAPRHMTEPTVVERRVRRRIAAGVASLAIVASLAATTSALGFGLSSPNGQPTNLQAGANSDLSIRIDVQEARAQLRDLTVHLPPGLVGNPLATPRCTEQQLEAIACPAASKVGSVSNGVDLRVLGAIPVSQTISGDVFNVFPRAGEPARFGIVLKALQVDLPIIGSKVLPPIVLQSRARLRQRDLGLDTILTNLPRRANVVGAIDVDVDIKSLTLNLLGKAGNPPRGFLRNPTSCKSARITFNGRSWTNETANGAAPPFAPTNCGALPFSPELTAVAAPAGAGMPIGLTTTISQTIEEAGLARADVILPNGIIGNPTLLANTCPQSAFKSGNCPASSLVGQAVASSPLQAQPLSGPVNLVEPPTAGLPSLGVTLGGALSLKLLGTLALRSDGRAVTTFTGLPDIPISAFMLGFPTPPGFVLAGVDLCSGPQLFVDGAFAAHSGRQATAHAPLQLHGCTGGGSGGQAGAGGETAGGEQGTGAETGAGGGEAGEGARKPTAKVKLAKLESKEPRLKLKVRAGSERLRKVRMKLPRQLKFAGGKTFKRGAIAKADGRKLKRRAIDHGKRTCA